MSVILATRKPIDEITIEDLAIFPIWEFISDEDDETTDETWIRPVNSQIVPNNETCLSVAATFTTASGLMINGLIAISTDDEIEIHGGALLYNGQYLFIPPVSFYDSNSAYTNIATSLNLSSNEIFPLKFTLAVPIERQGQVYVDCSPRYNSKSLNDLAELQVSKSLSYFGRTRS